MNVRSKELLTVLIIQPLLAEWQTAAVTVPKLCLLFVRTAPESCSHHRERKSNNFLLALLGLVASYVVRIYNILE